MVPGEIPKISPAHEFLWIVTKEEIGQQDLTIKCWVNGELRQESSISKMIFNIPSLIVTLAGESPCSRAISLRPARRRCWHGL